MSGFDLQICGVGSDCSANSAATMAQNSSLEILLVEFQTQDLPASPNELLTRNGLISFSGFLLSDMRVQVPPEVRRRRAEALPAGQDGESDRTNVSSNPIFKFLNHFLTLRFFLFLFSIDSEFWTFGDLRPFAFFVVLCSGVQGLSSVLKQRDFYDPRFITWIESRFDAYVHFVNSSQSL